MSVNFDVTFMLNVTWMWLEHWTKVLSHYVSKLNVHVLCPYWRNLCTTVLYLFIMNPPPIHFLLLSILAFYLIDSMQFSVFFSFLFFCIICCLKIVQNNLICQISTVQWYGFFFSLLQSVPINFKFKFYGHDVSKITIATGGNISKGVNIYCIFRGWKMDWRKIYIDIIGDYQHDERYWYLDSLKCVHTLTLYDLWFYK